MDPTIRRSSGRVAVGGAGEDDGIAAVIFDLDGVLVDTQIWWREVRDAWAVGHGITWRDEDERRTMGANTAQWARIMAERAGLDAEHDAEIARSVVDALVDRYRVEGAPLIPGAVEAVRRIAGSYPVAVASGSHRRLIEVALESIGLDEVVLTAVSADDVAHGKPAPDVYLEAARRLGVEARRCLVVEDSANGLQAARAAGMSAVLVPNAKVPPARGAAELADLVLERLDQLNPAAIRPSGRAVVADEPPGEGPMNANRARRRGKAGRGEAGLVRGDLSAWQRWLRYYVTKLLVTLLARSLFRVQLEGRERLTGGPVLYCFNHLGWVDPFAVITALPAKPRLFFFGPREEDMGAGARNRVMWWSGMSVPFRPGKEDLLRTARHVQAVFDAGGCLAIAGEGAIHVHEGDLLPLQEGTAYFALRAGVPIVPLAITGTSWLRFRRRVRVRVGEPIATSGRPTREAVDAYTAATWHALRAMVDRDVDPPRPGRFGRWLTDLFNDWGPGGREAAAGIRGPDPGDVPLPAVLPGANPGKLPAD